MRLFTAVDLPDAARQACEALQEDLDLSARWTDPEQFHVTLRFIGDTEPPTAARYENVLNGIDADPARCTPYGLDALPSRRTPRVLVVGLERTKSLIALYDAVSKALEAEGLDPETRTYRPHVTLARLDDASGERVHDLLHPYADAPFDPFTADTYHLYESTLTSDGAVHERRTSFALS